jgi:hypothetical protein
MREKRLHEIDGEILLIIEMINRIMDMIDLDNITDAVIYAGQVQELSKSIKNKLDKIEVHDQVKKNLTGD